MDQSLEQLLKFCWGAGVLGVVNITIIVAVYFKELTARRFAVLLALPVLMVAVATWFLFPE